MRSELVTGALKYVPNRFLLTRVAAKALREFHRPNTRIAETANQVLFRFSLSDPMARGPKPSPSKCLNYGARVESGTCGSVEFGYVRVRTCMTRACEQREY